MSYEQKRLTVRVYLPGPMQVEMDWESVARDLRDGLADDDDWYKAIEKHTTERPSRIDTGVDVVMTGDEDGDVRLRWMDNMDDHWLYRRPHREQIAALGFPTEPMQVVEVKAEGEVQP